MSLRIKNYWSVISLMFLLLDQLWPIMSTAIITSDSTILKEVISAKSMLKHQIAIIRLSILKKYNLIVHHHLRHHLLLQVLMAMDSSGISLLSWQQLFCWLWEQHTVYSCISRKNVQLRMYLYWLRKKRPMLTQIQMTILAEVSILWRKDWTQPSVNLEHDWKA